MTLFFTSPELSYLHRLHPWQQYFYSMNSRLRFKKHLFKDGNRDRGGKEASVMLPQTAGVVIFQIKAC